MAILRRRRRPRNRGRREPVVARTLRLPKSVDDTLLRLAEDERRSASNLIERLIREAEDEDHDVAEDPIRPRTIRLRESAVADLRRLAKVEGRSTNYLIEMLIRKAAAEAPAFEG